MLANVNWFELPAADTERARKFYGLLFNWETAEYGDDYHVIQGGPAGAIAARTDRLTQPRIYFSTDDIEASVAQVGGLGGQPGEIVKVPGVGKISHCTDDQGTPFSLYQPGDGS